MKLTFFFFLLFLNEGVSVGSFSSVACAGVSSVGVSSVVTSSGGLSEVVLSSGLSVSGLSVASVLWLLGVVEQSSGWGTVSKNLIQKIFSVYNQRWKS